jgi:hypothetical protein
MKEKEKNAQQCQTIKASHSLAFWVGEVLEHHEIGIIMSQLDAIFNRGLIDGSDNEKVQIPDRDAYRMINRHLIDSGFPVDEIARDLLERNLMQLLDDFINLVIERKKLYELGLLRILLNGKQDLIPDKRLRDYYLALIQITIEEEDKSIKLSTKVQSLVDNLWE